MDKQTHTVRHNLLPTSCCLWDSAVAWIDKERVVGQLVDEVEQWAMALDVRTEKGNEHVSILPYTERAMILNNNLR